MDVKDLSAKIVKFGEKKVVYDALDKELKPLNGEIKAGMKEHGFDKLEAGDFIASYSERESSGFNQEKLLRKLKELGLPETIKTIEIPDEKAIEALVFEGKLSAAQLADCLENKTTITLSVKKKKVGKED